MANNVADMVADIEDVDKAANDVHDVVVGMVAWWHGMVADMVVDMEMEVVNDHWSGIF